MAKAKLPTLRQFQEQFPTEEICLDHLMRTRYGARHDCEKCDREATFYRVKGRRSYACEWCGHQVYPTASTPFDRTRTPLHDWFFVMFQFCASRNGVAAKEVERQLGVTYKTAWRMCHQIREYMGQVDGDGPIGGAGEHVEIDEAFIGGSVKGKGAGFRGNKTTVVAMIERGGECVTRVVTDLRQVAMHRLIQDHVNPGSTINTDLFASYRNISLKGYRHQTVDHKAGQYVGRNGATVNSVEGFWSQLKRAINGTHIHVSGKHLPKYLAEFEYRHNMRNLPHLMLDRLMVSFVR
jgi:transposase-like protein